MLKSGRIALLHAGAALPFTGLMFKFFLKKYGPVLKLPWISVAGLQLRHNLPFFIGMDIFSVHGRICVTVLPSYVVAKPRDVIGAVDHSWSMTTPGRARNAQRVLAAVVNRMDVDGMSTSTTNTTVLYGFGDMVQDIVSAASWAFQPLASKDNVARYAEEVKVLSAVRRGIYSRIGRYATEAMLCNSGLDLDGVKAAVRPVALRPAMTAFLTFNPPYTYCNDVVNANAEGALEAAFLDACLQHDGVTRREARAAFWTAVATDSDRVTTEIMTAFASPADWEACLASKASAHKDVMLKPIVDDLLRLCTLAYNNAVDDTLPLTFFDTPLSGSVTFKNGGTNDVFESPIAKGRALGVCSGLHTGMPEKICMAMDSVHFLQFNSVGKYLSSTYAQGVTSYAPGLKLFHATLMGWCSNNESVKTPEDVLTLMRLTKTWSDVPAATKEKYVRQWFLQKHVCETVKT